MKASVFVEMVKLFGTMSIIAIGGASATLPEIHRQVVDQLHWMNDRTFADLLGVAQAAPGPNVLVSSIIGWYVAGAAGLAIATAAMIMPSCTFAFLVGRFTHKHAENAFWQLLKRVLAPIAIGLLLSSGAVVVQAADHNILTALTSLGMTLLVVRTNINPLLGIAAAAMLGVLAGRLGIALF